MSIRKATINDVQSIADLEGSPSPDPRRHKTLSKLVADDQVWLYHDRSKAVGFVVLEYSFFECGFVSLLHVNARYRQRGIGRSLMSHAESVCETKKLFTSTNESNRPMQLLLASSGFVPSGVVTNLDDGDPEIIYFKRCRLVPRPEACGD